MKTAQARERTQVLMDLANKYNGLVVGTGDLSELALGWATYNGDHMSMYGVNCVHPQDAGARIWWPTRPVATNGEADAEACCCWTFWTPRSAPSCCRRMKTAKSPRKPRIWSAPMSCTISSCIICCAWASAPRKIYRLAVLRLGRALQPTTTILKWLHDLLPPLLRPAVQALLPAGRPQGRHGHALPARRLAHARPTRFPPCGCTKPNSFDAARSSFAKKLPTPP